MTAPELVAHSLAENEAVIERGLATFVEVGRAQIRDGRQYRSAGWSDFDTYCRERWGFNRQRAHQLIEGADAVSTVVDAGAPAPSNEGQARELAPLKDDPEAMAEAMAEATAEAEAEGVKVTAARIRGKVAAQSSRSLVEGIGSGLRTLCEETVPELVAVVGRTDVPQDERLRAAAMAWGALDFLDGIGSDPESACARFAEVLEVAR